MNEENLMWWCYLHINGSIQAKRYCDPLDLKDADTSDFVRIRSDPFMAAGREDAIKQYRERLISRRIFHELTN